ncbi:MAG: lysophospholipid acyltransferase family protein [Lachnospiraceae bacterium]
MIRITYMVFKCFFRVPVWLYNIWKLGRPDDNHTEQERYDYLRNVVKNVNRAGKVEVSVFGQENIPAENGFILFPNHQGLYDMLALIDSCPNPVGVVIKKEASKIFLVKQVVELLHGIPMDRNDLRSSLQIIKQMSKEVTEGRNYIIFAEGTRSRDGNRILEFKSGTFKSAINAKCPIVPVALIDSFRPFDIVSIKREKVQVHYLEPLYPDQYVGLKSKEIAYLVHNKIQEKIDENMCVNRF